MATDALRVGSIEGKTREEFGGHAASLTRVVATARSACAGGFGFAKRSEERTLAPDLGEATVIENIACAEFLVENERARINIAEWIDEANDAAGSAEIETR